MIRYIEKSKNQIINILSYHCCSGINAELLKNFTDDKWANNLAFFINIEVDFPNNDFLSKLNKTHTIIFYSVHLINVEVLANFLEKISAKIDQKNIFVMVGYESQVQNLKQNLSDKSINDISIVSNMLWLLWTLEKSKSVKTPNIPNPSKKFSIFSRRYVEWRKLIYLDLLSKDLLDVTHFTFSNLHPDLPDQIARPDKMIQDLPDHLLPYIDKINEWLTNVPYSVNYDDPVSADVYELIKDSHINIVLETHIHKENNNIILTEKTYKPIVMKRPFIIYGPPNVIRTLREQGFKTFRGIINENYDLIQDHNQRRLAIVQEVERLNNLSDVEFSETMNECKKICDYNYDLVMKYKNKKLPESFLNLKIFGNK